MGLTAFNRARRMRAEQELKQEEQQEGIHNMTNEQLKQYAFERNIDLTGATKKAEIIEIIERNQ